MSTTDPNSLPSPSGSPSPQPAAPSSSVPPRERFERLLARFGAAKVELVCTVGEAQMKLRNILALKVGSVVTLESPVGEDLRLSLNGLPVGNADVLIADSSVRIRITKVDS